MSGDNFVRQAIKGKNALWGSGDSSNVQAARNANVYVDAVLYKVSKYRYVSISGTGWEYEQCPVCHEFRFIGVQFSRRAGFHRPKAVRCVVVSSITESGTARHICTYRIEKKAVCTAQLTPIVHVQGDLYNYLKGLSVLSS